jgi:hypothetical protein
MFKTQMTLVVLVATAVVAFAGVAHAGAPRVERLTPSALAQIPSKPILVATQATFAEAESKCLQAGGTWTVKMEDGEKVGRCDYTWCKTSPGAYQIFKWKIFLLAVCQDQYFKFSLSKGAHY